jgi:hypothetical protein
LSRAASVLSLERSHDSGSDYLRGHAVLNATELRRVIVELALVCNH